MAEGRFSLDDFRKQMQMIGRLGPLRNVIKMTRPSVSHDDVRRYEKMRDEFVEHNKKDRPRIGFIS